MKLNQEPIVVERSGEMTESMFGISNKDSAHIVSILRDKLYSNKVLAVVREYCTNAQDAHVEAGKKDVPIRVTLPGALDPTFRVRDFGPGLSEEEIRTVYALYGASTKRNSNEVVGQLGLGCKAAFAYTDRFTIVSWQNRIKKTYVAYIDETRVGKISLIHTEEDTGSSDGIEIQVPVKTNDIHLFYGEAANLLPFFRPLPETIGIILKPREYTFVDQFSDSGASFGININGYSSVRIVMGGVPYLINSTQLSGLISQENMKLMNTNMDLYVEIGEVDVAANRETLEFTKRTVETISKYFSLVKSSIENHINGKIEKEEFYKDANKLFGEITSGGASYRSSFWNSVRISNIWRNETLTGEVIPRDDNGDYELYVPSKYRKGYKFYNTLKACASLDWKIFYIDEALDWQPKLSKYLIAEGMDPYNDKVLAIKWSSRLTDTDIEYYKRKYHLDEYEIKNVSDCKVERKKRDSTYSVQNRVKVSTRSTSHLGTIFKLKPEGSRTYKKQGASQDWEKVTSVNNDKKYYVKLDTFKSEFPEKSLNTRELCDTIKTCIDLGMEIKDKDIYGVKEQKVNKLDSTWVPLVDEIKTFIEELKLVNRLDDLNEYYNLSVLFREVANHHSDIIDTSPAKKILKETNELKDFSKIVDQKTQNCLKLLRTMKMEKMNSKPTYEVTEFLDDIAARYPLLSIAGIFPIQSRYGNNSLDLAPHIVEHINLVENKKKEIENELSVHS